MFLLNFLNLYLITQPDLRIHCDLTAVSSSNKSSSCLYHGCLSLSACLSSWEKVLAWLQQTHTQNTHVFVTARKFLGNTQSVAACITVRVQYQKTANDE